MAIQWIQLVFMLFVILISAQLFSNALEYFGHKVGLSEGVTGSVFAAIATALPETTVPLLAVMAGTPNQAVNEQISVGAILGAPLMLSTLSTLMLGLSIVRKRGLNGRIKPEKAGFVRDLNFFLGAFCLAALAMYVPIHPLYWRAGISALLVSLYIMYLVMTFKASSQLVSAGHRVQPEEPLFLTKLGLKDQLPTILLQLALGLAILLFGAKGFITGVESLSHSLHLSPLLLSLLVIPLATELPEKVNSILWVRKSKDTLGFSNITGAMVFQGTLLPALGILLTPWQPSPEVVTGICLTILAASWLRWNASSHGLRILALFANGALYLIYLYLAFA